jgi:hypothetical protein
VLGHLGDVAGNGNRDGDGLFRRGAEIDPIGTDTQGP